MFLSFSHIVHDSKNFVYYERNRIIKGEIMKSKKMKLSMSLSVLIICLLVNTFSSHTIFTKAIVKVDYNPYNTISVDQTVWNWNKTEVLSIESDVGSESPSVAIDNMGIVHVAWYDRDDYLSSGGDSDIFFRRWNVSTSNWSEREVVSTESTDESYSPSLAVDKFGNIHVAWFDRTDYAGADGDYDVFYKRWDSLSASWTTTDVVSTESTMDSTYPSLDVDSSGSVHVAWFDITNYDSSGVDGDIFYKRWDSISDSWTTTEVVSTESDMGSRNPSLSVDKFGNVHIAWGDISWIGGADPDEDIFYKYWDSSSSSWTTTEVISTEGLAESRVPSLAIDSFNNIHIAWQDHTDYMESGNTDYDIFYERWDSSSSTWSTTEVISTESTSHSVSPSLAVDSSGYVHVAWYDYTNYDSSGNDMDIFYKRWDSISALWTTTEVISTESSADSYLPSLAVDNGGNVHIAWDDFTDYAGAGNDEDIFYKSTIGLPASPELAFIVPNPTEFLTISLDWNYVIGAKTYHVYRFTSYIWSVEELLPITTVSSSNYIDTVPSEGFYYYVVVAESFVGNSSHSNCQYVEVNFPDLDAPELSFILPNPTEIDSISLVWDAIDEATEYYVFRSESYIWSVENLTPIATAGSNSYIDTLPDEGFYFYVIVTNDGVRNSTHSNCEYTQYKLPTLQEFTIVSSLIFGTFVVLFVVMRTRKKKSKPN